MLRPAAALERDDSKGRLPPGARSPHPYRRQSIDIPDRLFVTNIAARDRHPLTAQSALPAPRLGRIDSDTSDYFSRDRRILTTSPSDSGTEADDEKPYLKGLPPARSQARKGLKGRSGAVTPSDFDGIKEALLAESRDDSGQRSDTARKATTKVAEKQLVTYSTKWRSELLRRVLEITFVCASTRWTLLYQEQLCGDKRPGGNKADIQLLQWATRQCELLWAGLLCYAVWLWYRHVRAAWGNSRDVVRKVPSPFDPAPILYPLLVPNAISAFVTENWQDRSEVLQLNMICGVVSLCGLHDRRAFWISRRGSDLSLIFTASWVIGTPWAGLHSLVTPSANLDRVWAAAPLVCTLVPTIQYFCGSSLLSAEIQLLAIGLVNLLFFASAPQTIILYALMWTGGVALLVSCRHIMKWSTMLARIPGWRFHSPRHTRSPNRSKDQTSALAMILQASSFFPIRRDSDTSEDRDWVVAGFEERQATRGNLYTDQTRHSPDNALDDSITDPQLEHPAFSSVSRRHTFPRRTSEQPPMRKTRKQKKQKPRPFVWMTRAQSSLVKWLYAIYCYLMVVGIILMPVRTYVQEHALSGNEPIGWALGYLLGDMSSFRFQVILNELDSWVVLPPHLYSEGFILSNSLDYYRHHYAGAANTRLAIAAWCVLNLILGIATVLQLRSVVEVDTRRKVFHGMMVSMFFPSIFIDPCFINLALALMLAIFLLLDLFRAAQLPPISRPLTHFLAPYVDGRDHKGPIVISPIFLLIGCAIPLWLSLASMHRGSNLITDPAHPWYGWEVPRRDLGMVAGVICVGMGDAAASLVGRRYGRRRWIWSGGKSLEGSAAFVVAVVAGLSAAELWRRLGRWQGPNDAGSAAADSVLVFLGKAVAAGAGASFTEAVLTGGNDNVVVPIVLWLLVKLFRI